MRVAFLVLVLGASVTALPVASAGSDCSPSPLGWVCWFDAEDDGVPERVFVYSTQDPEPVSVDVWRQPGSDQVLVGSGWWVSDIYSAHSLRVQQWDQARDGVAEERGVRAESWLPSDVGGWASVTVWDVDESGVPERVHVFVFHSHYGTYEWDSGAFL